MGSDDPSPSGTHGPNARSIVPGRLPGGPRAVARLTRRALLRHASVAVGVAVTGALAPGASSEGQVDLPTALVGRWGVESSRVGAALGRPAGTWTGR
jgi:hypothetical protein